MAERPDVSNIGSLQNESSAVAAINENINKLADAFEEVLSHSQMSDNTMNVPLDMNGQRILNLSTPSNPGDPIRLADVPLLSKGDKGEKGEKGEDGGLVFISTDTLPPQTPSVLDPEEARDLLGVTAVVDAVDAAVNSVKGVSQTAIQQALNANHASGGRTDTLVQGDVSITNPLTVYRGASLKGQNNVPPRDTPPFGSPFLKGSILRAKATLPRLMGQSVYGTGLPSVNIESMTLDGGCLDTSAERPTGFSVERGIHMSPLGCYFDRLSIQNFKSNTTADAVGLLWESNGDPTQPGFQPSWTNVATRLNCNGSNVGFRVESSDSLVAFSNFGVNDYNVHHKSSGGLRFIGNQNEVATQDGWAIESDKSGSVGSASMWVGNFQHLNSRSDFNVRRTPTNPVLGEDQRHNFVGNTSAAYNRAFLIESNVRGGQIVGHLATYVNPSAPNSANNYDIEFGGQDNGRWSIYGLSSDRIPSKRVKNLPPDCPILSTGLGGQYNRLNSLILSTTSNPVETSSQTSLECYGSATLLGMSGVNARFGWSRNNPGADPAVLLGSLGATLPYIGGFDGEATTTSGLAFVRASDRTPAVLLNRDGDIHSYDAGGNTRSLGTGLRPWNNIYYNQLVQVSDLNYKVLVDDDTLQDRLIEALGPLRMKLFKYIDAVQLKGEENARTHFGFIAQEVQKALEDAGLDPWAFGVLCRDKLEDSETFRLSIRFEQILALKVVWLERRLTALENKLIS